MLHNILVKEYYILFTNFFNDDLQIFKNFFKLFEIILGRFYRKTYLLEALVSTSEIEAGWTFNKFDLSSRQEYTDYWNFESQKSEGQGYQRKVR